MADKIHQIFVTPLISCNQRQFGKRIFDIEIGEIFLLAPVKSNQHFATKNWLNSGLFADGRKFESAEKILAIHNAKRRQFTGFCGFNQIRNFYRAFTQRVGCVIAKGNEHYFLPTIRYPRYTSSSLLFIASTSFGSGVQNHWFLCNAGSRIRTESLISSYATKGAIWPFVFCSRILPLKFDRMKWSLSARISLAILRNFSMDFSSFLTM